MFLAVKGFNTHKTKTADVYLASFSPLPEPTPTPPPLEVLCLLLIPGAPRDKDFAGDDDECDMRWSMKTVAPSFAWTWVKPVPFHDTYAFSDRQWMITRPRSSPTRTPSGPAGVPTHSSLRSSQSPPTTSRSHAWGRAVRRRRVYPFHA